MMNKNLCNECGEPFEPRWLIPVGMILCCVAGVYLGSTFNKEPQVIKLHPRVVASLYNKHTLTFTAVATNNHIFYLNEPTNGTFLKVDFIWQSSSDSNAIEKVRYGK